MSLLLKNVTNSIWHAFNSLSNDKKGVVVKSTLKVLTANIGTLLDLYGVEKGLEHYRSTPELNYEHYKYYLQEEVFSSLPDSLILPALREYEARIDEVCWLVCKKLYLKRDRPVFTDSCVYKLFRIFCLLAELVLVSTEIFEVVLASAEVGNVACQLVTSLGLKWDAVDFKALSSAIPAFRFSTFLAVLENKASGGGPVEHAGMQEAINDMYQTYLLDVLKKGYLSKRGYLLPTMREYWFVLQPTELSYYKSQDERDLCSTISLDARCWVDSCQGGSKDKLRFLLNTNERILEFAAPDHRSRLQWLSAFQTAISNSGAGGGYQRAQASRRCQQRRAESIRLHEENCRQSNQILYIEQTRVQLQQEKTARVAAEMQARELEAVHREEEKRLLELEDVRTRLEKLLEEETRAKRDEEIVRNLQSRVLREEWEKREELEQLQVEQRTLLDMERDKRREFEERQRQKESQLQEAEERLKQLDRELSAAQDRISISEKAKEVLEAKLRVMAPQVREPDRVRRALSFMPSTRERPVEFRRNTLRRTSNGDLP